MSAYHMTLTPGTTEWERVEGTPTYHDMKAAVGWEAGPHDLFDRVALPNGIDLWVNDEGLLIALPLCLVIQGDYGNIMLHGKILAARGDDEGETIALAEGDDEYLKPFEAVVRGPTGDHTVALLDFRTAEVAP